MVKPSSILGKNARSQLFSYKHNTARGRKIATSKLLAKSVLKKAGIPVPETYKIFKTPRDIVDFDWSKLPDSFALKPNKGLGGEGIIIVKKRDKEGNGWITVSRKKVTVEDLKLHAMDILEGAYSLKNVPDRAFIEEYIGRHKAFKKYAFRGFPDIRIIVFNKVPVMAMMRVPTKDSGGRANLHQGAIAVGIDIATGITTKAYWHSRYIKYKPETKRKLNGIKIPKWTDILEIAASCGEPTQLGLYGADIVLHPEKGPMVLELNYQPGLSIQYANKAGLRKRIERVEDLEVKDPEHGVKIAKALFTARFADRVAAKEGVKTVGVWEHVKILSKNKRKVEISAKIDTGAWRTSIDRTLAKDMGLLEKENVLWSKIFK
ncbi:MAG: sugar-transfer associated ATP-grasp domain-containing protein, partial [Patescibacteria group bacterium]